ncbi:hypothetical protein [Halomonas mongoliensis]|uniref:hypothetical protein n=1 Tax=Halomonas mongoliensis TaxID=321265 RepID=UPI00403AE336
MRLKTVLATAIAAAALPLAASAQASCQDDERLYAMGDFLEAQRNGTAEPLRLTAETYLNLTPRAREIIGDNLRLLDASCNTMQVVDGEPPVRVEMPFPLLYNAFKDAVLRGDERTSGILLRSFRAEPMDSAGFLGLFTLVSEDQALVERLASAAGMTPHRGADRNNNARCEERPSYLHHADLFVRFGGQVNGYEGRAWYTSGSKSEVTSVEDNLTHEFSALRGRNCEVAKSIVLTTASAAGAITIDMGNNNLTGYWRHQSGKIVKEAYDNWLEAGAPDDARPQSLFD